MSSKTRTRFVCQECGKQSLRYMGRCPSCGEFNSMVEETIEMSRPGARGGMQQRVLLPNSVPTRLADVDTEEGQRLQVPLGEFNRVMGGGIVPGSITLISGDPGVGKSTIIIQVAALLAQTVGRVLYSSGEESARQIKMRADRMNLQAEDLFLFT